MRWCRIRFVLLGLLLCVVHVVSGMCGQRFTDPASSALLADIVIEGKVRKTANPGPEQVFNITVAIRKSILKGANLINHGLAARKITVARFKNGGRDLKNCVGSVQEGRTYYFFLKDIAHPKGLHFEIATMPVNKTKKVANELRRILCDRCAQAPFIRRLTGPDRVMPGTKATLTCGAESKPNPEFSWYKDGELLPANRKGRVRIKSRKRLSTLQIKNVTEAEGGVYECVVVNAVGEARKDFTVRVVSETARGVAHAVPCVVQTLCLNGGTCLQMMHSPFCQCLPSHTGHRCEMMTGRSVEAPVEQATLLYERTLIIIGIVIAVLVFIIISIASYVLAEHGRKHFKDRQRLRQAQRGREHSQPALLVDRNSAQARTSKEPENRSENLASDLTSKQRLFILQESLKFSDQKVTHRDFNELPRQQLSDTKMDPNGQQQHESRQRLPAFSVYENVIDSNPRTANNDEGLKYNSASATVHPEIIEMSVLPESRLQSDVIDTDNVSCTSAIINNNGHDDSVDRPALLHVHSSDPLPPSRQPANNYHQITETSPLLAELNSAPSEAIAPLYSLPSSSSQPVITRHHFHDDASSKDDNRTAGQPLLQNHTTSSPIENGGHFAPPFESKSDRNLSRYALPDNSQQACPNDHGSAAHSLENNRLNKLPHSNTFPKSKVNGPTLDVCSESDDEDDVEIPYEKQLHISEEDLLLSQETFGDSSYLIMTTPTRQNAHEELVIGLLPNSVIRRPGMRKYQSEEGPAYSKLNSKNVAFLQLNVRSRSLDDPLGTEDDNPDPMRLNSTMAGSPDVETYDNMTQQHAHLHNNMYSYDPNDDSTPWDKDINKTDCTNFSKEDKINGLKDVLPDQQPIPI